MRLQRAISLATISVLTAASIWISAPSLSFAQGNASVSAVTLQVVPGQGGGECVVTPKGMVVPLPGAGVNANSVQIYYGSQGGFWYVDKNGQNVDLTSAVQQYRAMSGQAQTATPPQYAPAPPVYNNYSGSSSSGASALGTAAAAGLGAMTGAAMTNSYYNNNVPYGTPMYYPHGASPYYMNPQGAQVAVSNNYTANANVYNQHAVNMQKQQEWYQAQQTANPQQFKQWQQNTENPFVRQDASAYGANGAAQAGAMNRYGAAGAQGANAQGQAGRFGAAQAEGGQGAAAGQGGRFGGAGAQGGGRFGGAEGGQGAAGGRFGGAEGGQGAAGGRFGGAEGGRFGGAGAQGGGRFGGAGAQGGGRFGGGGRRGR